ncbi:MAG: AMIN domain-containing protein, partial [Desulfobulbaceae bacterium]|nr:AMIN domain-containing protein [Desulfobulbaceae bacterium]
MYILALFFVTLLLQPAYAQETGTADQGRKLTYVIQDIDVEKDGDAFFLRVKGDRPPTYTMYELFDPLRIVLDIAGASFEKSVDLPMDIKDGPVSRITGKVVDNREPFSARVEIFLAEDQEYSVEREKNDIKVVFAQAQE